MATSCSESEHTSLVGLSFWSHGLVNGPVLSGEHSTEENILILLQFQVCNERIAVADLGGGR